MNMRSSAGPMVWAFAVALLGACTGGSAGSGPTGKDGAAGTGSGGQSGGGAGGSGAGGAGGSAGAGGSTGAAGSGGAAGGTDGGSGGAAGATSVDGSGSETPRDGGTANGDAAHVMPSAGCGMAAGQALMTYVKYTETVPGVPAIWMNRNYYVWLPAGYDPNRAYATVFVGPGCGGRGNQGISIFNASGENAIVVGLDASPTATGRDCFMTESPTSPEIAYVDETLKQVQAKLCIDKSRIFIEGFSSGSWLTNLLGCARGNVFRAQGNASGCAPGLPPCTGPIPFMGAHDMGDGNNSYGCGTSNRDRLVKLNGCTTETMPYDPGPGVVTPAGKTITCVQYKGCMPGYPVVWCATTGLGHTPQEETRLSTFGFWNFWMSLP